MTLASGVPLTEKMQQLVSVVPLTEQLQRKYDTSKCCISDISLKWLSYIFYSDISGVLKGQTSSACDKCYLQGCRVNCPLSTILPGEEGLIYSVVG